MLTRAQQKGGGSAEDEGTATGPDTARGGPDTARDRQDTARDRQDTAREASTRTDTVTTKKVASRMTKLPERFGRYVLLNRMGEGGMAEVFRALVPGAEGFRRQVVLKRIISDHASAPTFVEMFAQEARISALLHHPNIVQVFDFGQVDGSYFLAMELVDGWEVGAINKALRRTHAKMPIEVAVHIAQEVLRGLAYAHTLKVQGYRPHIVHRDVSPSNIMCLRAGGVKLLDFGVASATGAPQASATAQPGFCGKLSYSAPEYVLGHGYDARIDLFAVGVVLWEMLVGERLFRGQTERETLAALVGAPIAAPSSKRPAIPEEIDRIVLKALERDPELRYQSAASMADDLEQVLIDRRYQPQTLPRLLARLFGDASTNSSGVTAVEELIQQSGSTIPPAALAPREGEATPGARVLKFLRSGTAALMMLVSAAGMFSFALYRAAHRTAGPRVVIEPARTIPTLPLVRPIPAPTPAPERAAAPIASSAAVAHVVPSRATPAPERRWTLAPSRRKSKARRSRPATANTSGQITSGSAIDPFAEAASRSGK